jgi:hypothetical protein
MCVAPYPGSRARCALTGEGVMSQNRSTRDDAADGGAGLGDDQGTRVGAPDQSLKGPERHSDTPPQRAERHTGSGSEASEGMHNAQQGGSRDESDPSGLTGQETGRGSRDGSQRAGSEPLAEGGDQHRSGYGGAGGTPVNSSDTREPPRKR